MQTMLPIWLFLFWTLGMPLLWLVFDHVQTHETMRTCSDGRMP